MLAHNERGSWFVTNGETTSLVSVRDNKSVISLQKGVTNSGEYKIHKEGEGDRTFTKLAGSVPSEVSEELGILTSGLNFAFQFDPPFLLKESGSAVAFTLGSLTGVSRIFEAVKEANRKRLAASSLMKTRAADLSQVQERLAQFGDLEERESRLSAAENLYLEYLKTEEQNSTLQGMLQDLLKCRSALAEIVVPVVPDFTELERVQAERFRLDVLLSNLKSALKTASEASQRQATAEEEQKNAEAEYHEELRKAGRCPTCQREIEVSSPIGLAKN